MNKPTTNSPAFAKYIKALRAHQAKKAAGTRTTFPYTSESNAISEFNTAQGGGIWTQEKMDVFHAAAKEAANN